MLITSAFDPFDHNVRPDQHTELVYVTQPWAHDALTRNVGNRRLSNLHVRMWQERFNKGRYRLTHQGLAFDHTGDLIDGQTRLHGFVRSDCQGFWANVTFNVDRASFAVMDRGGLREGAQLIEGPNADKKAAAARLLLRYPRIIYPTAQRIELEDLLETYSGMREYIDTAIEMAGPVYRETRINMPMLAAVLAVPLSTGYDLEKIAGFIDGLVEGVGLELGDPRLTLRNRFMIEARHLNQTARMNGLFFIIRAWNAYARGERLTKLQLPRGGGGIVTNDDLPEVES